MIRATFKAKNGQPDLLILGFSFGNLDRFRAEAPDGYVHIVGAELGIPINVLLVAGETEDAIKEHLSEFLGPNTKMVDNRRK